MKKIIIKDLELTNFKGFKHYKLEIPEEGTTLSAKNGRGKTSIKKAWEWLLCQNVPNVIPNIDGVDIGEPTTVKVTLSINDIDYVLERQNIPEFNSDRIKTGNKSIYKLDDIEMGQKAYQSKIAEILGDGAFEHLIILTDKEFFNGDIIKWQDRRKLLMQISGAEEESRKIIDKDDYSIIKPYVLKGYATSDIKSIFDREKKELKSQQNKNNILIESKQQEIDEYLGIDFDKISQELSTTKSKLTRLMNESREEFISSELVKHQGELSELTKKISSLQYEDAFKLKSLNEQKTSFYSKCMKYKSDYDKYVLDKEKLEENMIAYSEINDTCPTCGQKLPSDKLEELKNKNDKLLDKYASEINLLKNKIKESATQYNSLQAEYGRICEQLDGFVANEEIKTLENQITEVKSMIEVLKTKETDTSLIELRTNLQRQISDLEKEMNKKELLEKEYKKIKSWKAECLELADKIIECERRDTELQDFIREQTEFIVSSVNDKFSNGITWNLFKTNLNGNLEECCECMWNGVKYSSLSTGQQYFVNMEVLKVLQNYFDVNITVFADNHETITIDYTTDRQLIKLEVEKDKVLENAIYIKEENNEGSI